MKYLVSLVIIFNTFLFNSTVVADESNTDHDWVTSIGSRGLVFRQLLSDKHNLFYGFRFSTAKYKSKNRDNTYDVYDLELGYRYYSSKTSINTFFDSSLIYSFDKGYGDDYSYYSASFLYGVEKFISQDFSVEGSAGIGINYSDYNDGYSTRINLPITKIAVNYYF